MIDLTIWLRASNAAEFIDVSTDTICRRALAWRDTAVPGKIRYKLLKLGPDTRMERRYFRPDLELMLVDD
jgi:hypothetical protein